VCPPQAVHTVIDDHLRVAYAEIHDNQTAQTAIGVLRRAVSWFGAPGVLVERVLFDNGSCYKSRAWRDTCAEMHIPPKRTRPYPNEATRCSALPGWLHTYNHHRQHSAIGKVPPITRLTNLAGQYT
jgi:transposase InsO family protein